MAKCQLQYSKKQVKHIGPYPIWLTFLKVILGTLITYLEVRNQLQKTISNFKTQSSLILEDFIIYFKLVLRVTPWPSNWKDTMERQPWKDTPGRHRDRHGLPGEWTIRFAIIFFQRLTLQLENEFRLPFFVQSDS
jgi:hypothetical protein